LDTGPKDEIDPSTSAIGSQPPGEKTALRLLAIAIFCFGAFVRLFDLANNPPGLWQDEASTGLDAWFIWTTGQDRAGAFLPVISRSFGDYPLALYRYLDAPIVGLFGMTAASERLVAAIGGTLMIAATYFAVQKAIGEREAFGALLAGALTPTWIHFSRYGSEAILLPLTLITTVAFVEHARVKGRAFGLWAGAIVLAASAYTYHAMKIVLPLWLLAFVWYERAFLKELWRTRRVHLVGPAVVFVLGVLPSAIAALTPEGMARGKTVAAWTHSSGFEMLFVIANNYLTYFDPGFLFVRGGPAVAQSIPGVGLWSLIDLPLMIVGALSMIRGRGPASFHRFLLFWFLIGPLPGGITFETHNVGRMIAWLPAPQIISGIGFAVVLGWIEERRRSGARLRAFAAASTIALAWIATGGFVAWLTLWRYPRVTERDWQFEISRAILCAKAQRGDRMIVVSPNFQAADVFASFHLSDLPPLDAARPAWLTGYRQVLPPNEIYVAPSNEQRPLGQPICDIRARAGGETRAFAVAGLKREDEQQKRLDAAIKMKSRTGTSSASR
jgi:4-amino-4-deoxy-L-arabinose transferase-like glycosyltransferase